MANAIRISNRSISVESVVRSVSSKAAGATVVFVGTVRDMSKGTKVDGMDLEAAENLARKDLVRICGEAEKKFRITKISVAHRVGKLRLGDVIVVLAVSAPHRREAFSGCRYIIEELKKSTPIWKKEYGPDGEKWV